MATLAVQLDAVQRQLDELARANARGRTVRLVLFLAVFGFVAVTCFLFYRMASQFQSDENLRLLARTAQDRLSTRQEEYLRQLQILADNTSPVLTQAFLQQAKKDLPTYMQLVAKERDQLADNLQTKLEKRLDNHYQQVLAQHDKTLKEEFPLVQDKELHRRMMANLETVVKKLVKKYYVDELHNQVVLLYTTWDEWPAAAPAAKGEPPTEDQFIAGLLELLTYRMSHPEGSEAYSRPSKRPAPATPKTAPVTPKTAPAAPKKST
jgi:hypothetical protein